MAWLASVQAQSAGDEHPSLEHRKALAVRWLAANHLRLRLARERVPCGDLAQDFIQRADTAARSTDAIDDATSFDRFLRETAREMFAALRGKLHQARHLEALPGTRRAVLALAREARSIDCQNCARRRGPNAKRCQNTSEDRLNLDDQAPCMAWLVGLFRFLVELAEEWYRPLLDGAAHAELAVRLQTRATHDRVLGAKTRFPPLDDAPARSAQVVVDLPVQHLDDTHVGRLPYTLFHEIFVHAPESWSAVGRREPTNERCPLREGFVDAVAHEVLRRRLTEQDRLPPGYEHFAEHWMVSGRSAHYARADLGGDGNDGRSAAAIADRKLVGVRRDGLMVFERLSDRGAADAAIRLALCLNMLALSPRTRENLVIAMNSATAADPLARPVRRTAASRRPPLPVVGQHRRDWFLRLRSRADAHDLDGVARAVAELPMVAPQGEYGT